MKNSKLRRSKRLEYLYKKNNDIKVITHIKKVEWNKKIKKIKNTAKK